MNDHIKVLVARLDAMREVAYGLGLEIDRIHTDLKALLADGDKSVSEECPRCGPAPAVHPCSVCGKDIGFDAPSGVCSERCLRDGQGFYVADTVQPTAEDRFVSVMGRAPYTPGEVAAFTESGADEEATNSMSGADKLVCLVCGCGAPGDGCTCEVPAVASEAPGVPGEAVEVVKAVEAPAPVAPTVQAPATLPLTAAQEWESKVKGMGYRDTQKTCTARGLGGKGKHSELTAKLIKAGPAAPVTVATIAAQTCSAPARPAAPLTPISTEDPERKWERVAKSPVAPLSCDSAGRVVYPPLSEEGYVAACEAGEAYYEVVKRLPAGKDLSGEVITLQHKPKALLAFAKRVGAVV